MSLYDFQQIQELVRDCNSGEHPTAVQAILTGLLAARVPLTSTDSRALLLSLIDLEVPEHHWPALQAWLNELQQQLFDMDMAFQPLLPNDDQPQIERIMALAVWAEHFLTGFGLGMGRKTLSPEQQELLDDLMSIAQLDITDMEDSSEEDYLIVAEHMRLIAMQLSIEPQHSSSSPIH